MSGSTVTELFSCFEQSGKSTPSATPKSSTRSPVSAAVPQISSVPGSALEQMASNSQLPPYLAFIYQELAANMRQQHSHHPRFGSSLDAYKVCKLFLCGLGTYVMSIRWNTPAVSIHQEVTCLDEALLGILYKQQSGYWVALRAFLSPAAEL